MEKLSLLSGLGVGTLASGVGISVIGSTGDINFWFEKVRLNNSGEIISKYRELPCAGNLFGKINWNGNPPNENTKSRIEGTAEEAISLTNEQTVGCIAVWWQKKTYKSQNWRGNWNLTWALRDEKYGTIFTSTMIADYGQVYVDSVAYVLEKKGKKWTTIGNWKTGQIRITKDNKASETVQPDTSLIMSTDNWDLIKNSEATTAYSKICSKNNQCANKYPDIVSRRLSFNFVKGKRPTDQKEYTADKWSSNVMSKWMATTGIFGVNFAKMYEKTNGYYQFI